MKLIISISLFLFPLFLVSQNLINNGSFEEYNECPSDYSQNFYEPYVKYWESPNAGTPDYFNVCSQKCGVPFNWVGTAEAFQGNAYMGIIACMQQFDAKQIAYREYIRIKLNDTLQKGKPYYASMQVRLGLSCSICCNGLGMYITSQPLNSGRKINYPFEPQITYRNSEIIASKNNWTQICGSFTANGDELYLIIGNFLSNQQMKFEQLDENLIPTSQISPMAYYLIDDVKLMPINDSSAYDCQALTPEKLKAFEGELIRDEKLVLDNLYFQHDKSVILIESFNELDRLALALKKQPNLRVRIYGHTDNSGSKEYNFELSEKRAVAVRNYLLAKGVSKFRMDAKGFGDTQPISDNTTEAGRQQNRRVEIEAY